MRFVVVVSISYFEGRKEMVAQCESRTNTRAGVKTRLRPAVGVAQDSEPSPALKKTVSYRTAHRVGVGVECLRTHPSLRHR